MMLKSPAMRLTLALLLLSINLLLMAHWFGLVPDADRSALEMRKSLCESLALQFSAAAKNNEFQTIQQTLRAVVERNDEIRSAAIRTTDGNLIALAGDHLAYWKAPEDGKSTPTQVQVPVFLNHKPWAKAEMRFAPLWTSHLANGFANSFVGLLVFFGISGYICYFFVIKRTLRELDPSAVIPQRVQKAFDVLQEGVLILDEKEQIVMANRAFAGLFGKSPAEMLGVKGSELGWLNYQHPKKIKQLPWFKAMADGQEHNGTLLTVLDHRGQKIKLTVNVAVVADPKGTSQGTLLTFDDITQLEEKNFELGQTIEMLELANDEIQEQSRELEFLAERDPLTHCLNRRSLGMKFEALFSQARQGEMSLSCLMADIDFFKSINDQYGHATGDEVIKSVADILKSNTRDVDLVGRYGGEEFCTVIVNLSPARTAAVAERIRKAVENSSCAGVKVTISMGVAFLYNGAGNPEELINQADKALYAAKKSGRNRVVYWGHENHASGEDNTAPDKGQSQRSEASEIPDQIAGQLQHRVLELEGQLEKRTMELQHSEMFDAPSGLPTRALFADRIGREISRGRRKDRLVAVLSMTVDTVKRIQETLGHDMAEQLVKACGQRLNGVLREDIDTVATTHFQQGISTVSLIQPAEFGILLADITRVDHVTWVMKRLLDAFETPFLIEDNEFYLSAYFGVSIFPHDGQTADELYCSATNACVYAQKHNGTERYQFSSRRLNEMAADQLRIENALHEAIQNDEFQLYYQPKIAAASGRVAGYEALLRWHNQQLGAVPPDRFIPVAEQSGQIDRIGDWVIYNACRQLRDWNDMGLDIGSVAINLSGVQLRQPNLADRVKRILKDFHIPAHQLEIELTESALINTRDQSLANLEQFKAMGLQVAMDDFGTGYASIAYLRKIPLSGLKIDRSFVADIDKDEKANRLIASIVAMAHGLGLEITAEGVEQKHQADHLTALGCEYLQGYYFSRPIAREEVVGKLQDYPMARAG
jgi:diguanylate cyclase (GGDEF)-like protein/PAS domain S-box-containing protein